MSTGDNTDFSKLSGLHELQEAARQLFSAYVLTDEEYRSGRIAPTSRNTTLQLLTANTSQSQDIETQRAAAIQKLQGAMSKVPLDQRGDLQARIDAVATATQGDQIDALTLEALRDIEAAAQFANTGTNIQDLQSLEDDKKQQLAEQWAQYRADSQALRGRLDVAGYRDTPENEEKIKKLWAQMEQLEVGSPEWIKTANEIYSMDVNFFGRTEDQLRKEGKHELADEVHQMRETAEREQEKYNKISNAQEQDNRADRIDKGAVAVKKAAYFIEPEEALSMHESEQKPYLAEKKATIALAHAEIDTSETGNLTPLSVGTKTTDCRTLG